MSDQAWNWLLVAGGALAGVLARVGTWRRPDNGVDWWKASGELLSIPSFVYLSLGGAELWMPNADVKVVALGATALALIGVAAIEGLILRAFNKKIDG